MHCLTHKRSNRGAGGAIGAKPPAFYKAAMNVKL